MKNRFEFYEVVRVESCIPKYQEVNGHEGVVLGMAQSEDQSWSYAVQIFQPEDGWDIPESELISTGRVMKRENLYPGNSVRVEVDPESGEGSVGAR